MTEAIESLSRRLSSLEAANGNLALRLQEANDRLAVHVAGARTQGRRFKLAMAGFVAALGTLMLVMPNRGVIADDEEKTVRCRRLIVEDDEGNARAILHHEKGKGVNMTFKDHDDKDRLVMGVDGDTALFAVMEKGHDRPRAFLGSMEAGSGLFVCDKDGNVRGSLMDKEDGGCACVIMGTDMKPRCLMGMMAGEGHGRLKLFDHDGGLSWEEPRDSDHHEDHH